MNTQENYIHAMMEARWGRCDYDDLTHTYEVNGAVVPSITTIKKQILPPFDAEGTKARLAAKRGMSVGEIQAEWDAITHCGTMVHELLEAVLFAGNIKRPTDHSDYSPAAHERLHTYKRHGIPARMLSVVAGKGWTPVAAEMRVWRENCAGTLDLLCRDTKGEHHIVDWKCNSRGGMSKIAPWTKPMLTPFIGVAATKLAEYSVQLESYASVLEEVGIPMGESLIVHGYFDKVGSPCVDAYNTMAVRKHCGKWLKTIKEKD